MSVDGKVMDRVEGEGMTLEQIAEIEGVSRAMIWFTLQSAYRKLRRNREAIALLRHAAEMAERRRSAEG